MKSLVLVKIMALMITETIAANSSAVTTSVNNTPAAHEQIMTISCHDCHENFDADISATHANCPHCGHSNEFSG